MVFIPPPHVLHQLRQNAGKPTSPHEMTVSMFVVFVIALLIALAIFILGPLSGNPPPLGVGLFAVGFALLFGVLTFIFWMKEQSDPDASDSNNQSSER